MVWTFTAVVYCLFVFLVVFLVVFLSCIFVCVCVCVTVLLRLRLILGFSISGSAKKSNFTENIKLRKD